MNGIDSKAVDVAHHAGKTAVSFSWGATAEGYYVNLIFRGPACQGLGARRLDHAGAWTIAVPAGTRYLVVEANLAAVNVTFSIP